MSGMSSARASHLLRLALVLRVVGAAAARRDEHAAARQPALDDGGAEIVARAKVGKADRAVHGHAVGEHQHRRQHLDAQLHREEGRVLPRRRPVSRRMADGAGVYAGARLG